MRDYQKSLEKARELHRTAGPEVRSALEKVFTELVEDEDERVRKDIISFVEQAIDAGYGIISKERKEKWIAWLEKQGKLMKALQIANARIGELIEENYYLKEQFEEQGKNSMGISEATKQKLENNLHEALEKETPESCNEFLDEQGEQKPVFEMKTPEESLGIDSDTYNKIVDECVYGEQKPIVILKFRVGDTIKNKKTNKIFTISDYSLLYEYYHDINHYHEIKFSEQDDWELVEQNPAWGEEDERTYKSILYSFAHNYPLTIQQQEFVKSLKDRVQPRQEWSEEDERNASYICAALDAYYRLREENNNTSGQEKLDTARAWINNRLKSLMPKEFNPYNKIWTEEDDKFFDELHKESEQGYKDASIEQLKDIYSRRLQWLESIKSRLT